MKHPFYENKAWMLTFKILAVIVVISCVVFFWAIFDALGKLH
ncbi:hypothetical protein LCGC14_0477060 [marine sediment metagenome]|uniref:Uncharacterized protein n=1 Tax=marine sediment metagenome TaxID=412755 RepID=A0A0F9SFS2_9ZZZZ